MCNSPKNRMEGVAIITKPWTYFVDKIKVYTPKESKQNPRGHKSKTTDHSKNA